MSSSRESREAGEDPEKLLRRLANARKPIEAKREEHERQLHELSSRWDSQHNPTAPERRATEGR